MLSRLNVNFRDQDHVGAARDASRQRDVPGIPAHDFQHHDTGVAGRRRLQPVQRLGGDTHGGVVPDGGLCQAQIVVDRLGHAH